ncbi:hypothetical protein SNE40_012143 [Patella caerulea]|uniref:CST complex subunit CTC1 n=1 Tax=Patella caerulea TaxID=87958 RepID=A0AAN8PVE6_PATCE
MEVDSNLASNCPKHILSAKDAYILLQNRHNIKHGTINIKGCITSLSELFRVRKDQFYCILLDDILKIMIMREELINCHKWLIPGNDYIFYSFKPASLKKGVEVPFNIYLPSSKSHVYRIEEHINTYTLTEWLKENLVDEDKLLLSVVIPEVTSSCKFVSYQGVIESIISVEFGIYNLDGNILLYTSYLPSAENKSSLQVGSKIVIHNVHHGGGREFPRIHLYCCAKTTLKIVDQPLSIAHKSSKQVEDCKTWVRHMINSYNLQKEETEHLKQLYETVYNVWKAFKGERCHIVQILQAILSEECCPWLKFSPRNITEEFFLDPHTCFYSQTSKENRIACILPVERLIEIAYEEAGDLDGLKDKYKCSNLIGKDLGDLLYWNYNQQTNNNQQIIIGWLDLCKTTGRLLLRDHHSKIDVIISSSEQTPTHVCDQTCLTQTKSNCPFLQIQNLNQIIAICCYSIVNERFLTGHFSNIESVCKDHIEEFQHFAYLQFSMLDCKFLTENVKQITEVTKGIGDERCELRDENQNKLKGPPTRKHSLVHDNFGHSIDSTDETKRKREQKVVNGRKCLWISHKESLITETKKTNFSLRFSILGCIVENINSDHLTMNNINPKYEPVELIFQDISVKWYNILESGSMYEVSNLNYVNYKVPATMSKRVNNSIKNSKARLTVTVPSDAHFVRIFDAINRELEKDSVKDIEDVLSCCCKEALVSFVGIISGRKHCDSGLPPKGIRFNEKKLKIETQRFLSVSMVGNQCVQLQIKSLNSDSDVTVYLKLERTSYPLGLLPGTVVKFERLERKVSKRGIVYCQYIMVSSYRILSVRSTSHNTRFEDKRQCIDDINCIRYEYLLEVINKKDMSVFKCCCRIYQILNLRLESICCICGSRVQQSTCSNPCCKNTAYKLTGKISFLIDDGSTVAKTFLTLEDEKVQTFFDLNKEEIESFLDEIQDIGEIYISNFSAVYQDTDIATFIQRLCNGYITNRLWCLTLKPFYSQNYNHISLEELEVRNVHVGDTTIETRCLPYFTLECLHIEGITS